MRKRPLSPIFRSGILLACSAALLAPALLGAQKIRQDDVAEVIVVEVPVQVTKDGKPVRGLTPEQFELFDGRKRRELTGFDAWDLSGLSAERDRPELRIPAVARRRFLFFFDLSFSAPDSIERAREAARELVAEGLSPTDLVGVATWATTAGLDLILNFTSDRRQVELAIETLGPAPEGDASRDPLGLTIENAPEGPEMGRSGSFPDMLPGGLGMQSLSPPVARAASVSDMQASNQRAGDKKNILAFAGSLTRLAETLHSVDGRKYLVLLSEGFDSSIVLGQGAGSTEEERAAIENQNLAAAMGAYREVDSDQRFGDTFSQNELGRMLRDLVRADCVIEAVDIGGLRAGADDRPRGAKQGLFMLAEGTGGEVFEGFNNLTKAMERMLERTSVTYVLAFQPEDLKLDGQFHKLKVKLEGGPKGARLVYRPGYFAPRPYSELSARERSLSAASRLFGDTGGPLAVATLAAPFEIASQSAYVPSLIEIDGADLLKGNQAERVTVEIYAYAVAGDGQVRDFYNQILGIDLEKAGPSLQQTGLKFWNHFELPPGSYVARILVRNADTGASGVSVFPFRVPDAERDEPALLAPLFPEPPDKWLMIRGERATGSTRDYPFTIQGEFFIPAAKPVLVPGQLTPVLLAGYGLGDSARLAGELLTLEGQPVEGVSFDVGERRPADQATLGQWAATIQIDALEAGDYVLRVTATEPGSGESFTSSLRVSVSG